MEGSRDGIQAHDDSEDELSLRRYFDGRGETVQHKRSHPLMTSTSTDKNSTVDDDRRSQGSGSPDSKREEDRTDVENLDKAICDDMFPKNIDQECALSVYESQQTQFCALNTEEESCLGKLEKIYFPYVPDIFEDLKNSLRERFHESSTHPKAANDDAPSSPEPCACQPQISDEALASYLEPDHARMLLSDGNGEDSTKEAFRLLATERKKAANAEKKAAAILAAERKKAAAILAAEKKKAAAILAAERKKAAAILAAEKKKAAAIQAAERKISHILRALGKVEAVLSAAAHISQAEVICSTRTHVQETSRAAKYMKIAEELTPKEERKLLPFSGPLNHVANLFRESKRLDERSLFHEKNLCSLSLGREILNVCNAFNNVFASCTKFLESHTASTVPMDSESIKPKNLEAYKEHLRSGLRALDTEIERIRTNSTDPSSLNNEYHLPGPRSQECEGSQQIFDWLLKELGFAVREEEPAPKPETRHSPHKSIHQREKRFFDSNGSTKLRICDFIISKPGKFLVVVPSDALPLVIEIKPLVRSSASFDELCMSAKQQVVNQLSSHLRTCFNFAGFGTNGYATGIVATLAFVQVIRLELHGMGTETAKLQLLESDRFPLMTKENFYKWAKSNPRSADESWIQTLGRDLYDNRKEDLLGFKLLYQCMKSQSHLLVSRLWENPPKPIGTLLGVGSFSYVFSYGQSEQVIKVSRAGRKIQIEREVEVLRSLAKLSQTHDHLPRLIDTKNVEIRIGASFIPMPAVISAPRGIALLWYGKSVRIDLEQVLQYAKAVGSALEVLHKTKYIHCDVSLNNIVYVKEADKVVLVDFSNARQIDTRVDYFDGTMDTAHRDIHCLGSWTPMEFHDTTSLAFAMVMLCNGCKPAWEPIHRPFGSDLDAATKRLNCAKDFIERLGHDELKAFLAELVRSDEERSCRGCACQKTHCDKNTCGCKKFNQFCNILCKCNSCHNGRLTPQNERGNQSAP